MSGEPTGNELDADPRPSGSTIRVVVADDQALVLGALAALLDLQEDLTVVAAVSDGAQAVSAAKVQRADVALLDIQMPVMDGLAAAAAIRASVPTCRVIIVTTFGRPGYLRRAMEAGATGYLVKDSTPEALADAVRRVHHGLRVVDPDLAAESLTLGASPLSGRERDVLVAAKDGATVAQIAGRLFLSEGTVRNHLSAAIGKTESSTRAEAARLAEERGWL